MPLYSYVCPSCGWGRTDIRTIEQRHEAPTCDRCRSVMKLVLDAVRGIVKNPAVPRRS